MVRIGSNERKILALLEENKSLTCLELAEQIYGKKLECKYLRSSHEYSSVNRSLLSLEQKGLVKRTSGKIQWSKIETK